jgi:hypothetical protein
MNLSEHFSIEELTCSDVAARNGWGNYPDLVELENLTRLAELLEQVRMVLNKSIMINSGYRSKQVNDAVGSKDTSQHRLGCAADIRVSGMTLDAVCKAIRESEIQFDQLIKEFDSWTHISVTNNANDTPRNQMLVIDNSGTRAFR